MATTIAAPRPPPISRPSIDNTAPPTLSSLSLNAAPSTMTFFSTLLSPPHTPLIQPGEAASTSAHPPPTPLLQPGVAPSRSRHPNTSNTSTPPPPPPSVPQTLPEPSPPLTPQPPAQHPLSLSSQINAATKPIHTRLNRRILGLLPLALPPCAEGPGVYVLGMQAVGSIYRALEESVQRAKQSGLVEEEEEEEEGGEMPTREWKPRLGSIKEEEEIGTVVDFGGLDLRGLMGRAERLEGDLMELRRRIGGIATEDESVNHVSPENASSSTVLKHDPSLDNHTRHTSPALSALTSHITSTSRSSSPHLLLAPLHQFTLALFNGGTHIRRRLSSTPSTFWNPLPLTSFGPYPTPSPLPEPSPFTLATNPTPSAYFPPVGQAQTDVEEVLTFWFLHGGDEEEGVKMGFKRGFEMVAKGLTERERGEVVGEVVRVMEMLEEVVEEIVGGVEAGGDIPWER